LNTSSISPLPSRGQSSVSGQLWLHYCKAVAKKSLNRAAASAAWNGWLRTFIPDERDRAAILAPKILQEEGAGLAKSGVSR
jgi:hypothetical protein